VLPQAVDAIRKAGFEPAAVTTGTGAPDGSTEASHSHSHSPSSPHEHSHGHDANTSVGRLVAALLLAIAAEAAHLLGGDNALSGYAGLALAAVAIGLSGIETYTKGWMALRRGRLNINALMSVAVTGAFVIGQWPEAAMVMALYAIAEWIEGRAAERARHAIQGLVALAPAQAEVRQPDGGWKILRSSEVGLEAVVRIRPGEILVATMTSPARTSELELLARPAGVMDPLVFSTVSDRVDKSPTDAHLIEPPQYASTEREGVPPPRFDSTNDPSGLKGTAPD
jgi:Cd2+/Zn2+-exporting ATPase